MNRRLTTTSSSLVSSLAFAALAVVLAAITGCAADADEGQGEEQSADAFTGADFGPSPSDYPTESNWAIGRVRRACHLTASQVEGAKGEMTHSSGGVFYTVTNGDWSWSAFADSDSIFSRAFCMPE